MKNALVDANVAIIMGIEETVKLKLCEVAASLKTTVKTR